MLKNNFISQEEYDSAAAEKVSFVAKGDSGIKAPHFVFYVIDYLKKKYGEEILSNGGLRVTTSLDYDLQSIGEKIARDYALQNIQCSTAGSSFIYPPNGVIFKDRTGNYFITGMKNRREIPEHLHLSQMNSRALM